jgi:flagellar biosynthesis protein FlhF
VSVQLEVDQVKAEPETTTFRGGSLEELLPQIRGELGEDAVIVRHREGIVGGFGGFFGKKCIEVDAHAADPSSDAPPLAMPARAVVDAYDTGDARSPQANLPETNPLLETLMAQTSPFAAQLSDAIEAAPLPVPVSGREGDVRHDLAIAGVPDADIDAILDEVERALRPFEPEASVRDLARRALARRVPVAHGWRSRRRTIAVVGLAGSGRTRTAASLASAYAATGRSVTALSLEPARAALELARLTDGLGVELEIADAPELVARAKRKAEKSDVVVVDTPPLVDSTTGERSAALDLLAALRPSETHLLVSVGAELSATRSFLTRLSADLKPTRLLLTHGGLDEPTGVGVGLALATRTPISFVADGRSARLRPAEPDQLARMVLQ